MAKAKAKKAEKKEEVEKKGEYHLYIKLNDREHELDTDNVGESIMSFRPEFLKTSVVIKVTKNGKTLDRYFYLNDGKRLFNNRITLEAFVRNLLF